MSERNRAYFAVSPKTNLDLSKPHLIQEEVTYTIKARVYLSPIKYKNFVTDMLVDRDYIERASQYCDSQNDKLECVLISKKGSKDGILVVPGENGHIKMAAISSEKSIALQPMSLEFWKKFLSRIS